MVPCIVKRVIDGIKETKKEEKGSISFNCADLNLSPNEISFLRGVAQDNGGKKLIHRGNIIIVTVK